LSYTPTQAANLLRTCCGLVGDTATKSATSWQQVVVMEFGKRHHTRVTTDFLPAPTCYGLQSINQSVNFYSTIVAVRTFSRTCYAETGVMDFGFKWSWNGSSKCTVAYSTFLRGGGLFPYSVAPAHCKTSKSKNRFSDDRIFLE